MRSHLVHQLVCHFTENSKEDPGLFLSVVDWTSGINSPLGFVMGQTVDSMLDEGEAQELREAFGHYMQFMFHMTFAQWMTEEWPRTNPDRYWAIVAVMGGDA